MAPCAAAALNGRSCDAALRVGPSFLSEVIKPSSSALIQQAGLKRSDARTGAVTLIQRFGSAANLNIHLRCLV